MIDILLGLPPCLRQTALESDHLNGYGEALHMEDYNPFRNDLNSLHMNEM